MVALNKSASVHHSCTKQRYNFQMLSELLQQYMERHDAGSKRLADWVNEQFEQLNLSRNTIQNWSTGTVKRVRYWQPLLAIATVLHLSVSETNALLTAAGHFTLAQLRASAKEADLIYFEYWSRNAPSTPDVATGFVAFSTPLVTLTFPNGSQCVLHGAKTFGIGRADAIRNWFPVVQLENFGGVEAGVSRKHGAIILTEQAAFVEDHGSHNGTKHNGKRLVPHRRSPLADGDKLSFGQLVVEVRITPCS